MRDEGLVDTDEPFEKLLALGMVLKDGVKMSKSAGDAGDPKLLLDAYGADAVRMAMMFAAPPEQSFEWSEHGVESANRWLRTKLFKTVDQHLARGTVEALNKNQLNDSQKDTRRVLHETIAKAADDYGRRLSFNTVVSSSMSLMNHLLKTDDRTPQGRAVAQEVLTAVVTIMAPITPHICHELLLRLTGEKLEEIVWLDVDEDALVKTTVPIIVQVNGKLRGKLEMSVDDSKQDIEAAARKVENVEKFIEGKTIRKVIVVPAKLINFVVS